MFECCFVSFSSQIYTWIYENRVSKHFVISLNFPPLSLFTVLFAYIAFWLFCG